VIFEPNNETLWDSLRSSIDEFMTDLFKQKDLQRAVSDQVFSLKFDSEATLYFDKKKGIINVLIGLVPVRPTECILIKLSQKVSLYYCQGEL